MRIRGLLLYSIIIGFLITPSFASDNQGTVNPAASNTQSAANPAVANTQSTANHKPASRNLLTGTAEECNRQAHRLTAEHDSIILRLENVVSGDTSGAPPQDYRMVDAIELLGRYHAAHSSGLLVGQLTFKDPAAQSSRDEDTYPAVGALEQIGSASLPALLKRISINSDALVSKLGVEIITNILGPHVGFVYVSDWAGREKDPQAKQKLLDFGTQLSGSK